MNTLVVLRQWGTLACLAICLTPVRTPAAQVCASCNEPIRAEFLLHKNPARKDTQPVCQPCSELATRCALCGLPMKHPAKILEDGRLLCEFDAKQGVFSEVDTQRLFEGLKGELFPLFSGLGTLPNRNIVVRLVDGRQMAAVLQSTSGQPDQVEPMAFARSRRVENGPWNHEIYVMQGLGPARLAAALAHEYTHLWLRENLPPQRQLQKNTLEGFCELVAYQIMNRRGEELQRQAILANAYSRGQIQAFVKALDEHQFYRVVQWIKWGVDSGLSPNNTTAVLSLERPAPRQELQLASLQPVATAVPEELTLKGVSGSPSRRFALINDQTLQKNDVASVRVGTGRVRVRCLEVGERSARVQVEGQTQPIELSLEPKK